MDTDPSATDPATLEQAQAAMAVEVGLPANEVVLSGLARSAVSVFNYQKKIGLGRYSTFPFS
jgi:hypothetical protein